MRKALTIVASLLAILTAKAQNPYLPLWEHLPDGEPRVFEDPDHPGKYRIYIIGSHDVRFGSYCGPDIHEWSAPVEDPSSWTDEGPIFTYETDGKWDVMFAPDLVEIPQKDGSKVYYLYPHSRGFGREAMVCRGSRPDGPFTPVNLTEDGKGTLPGSIFGFDPSVFVEKISDPSDPDFATGFRAYGYWGFQRSSAAQLDQNTMWSARPGTDIIPYFIPASASYGRLHPVADAKFAVYPGEDLGDFNFFEASSIRKVGNKYVWVFSGHSGPDYGLPSSNSTLRYAYSDSPVGPWKSGGVLVDSRAIVLGEDGTSLYEGYSGHNTHGSLQNVDGQWYVFYHRAPRGFGFARQAMADPVTIVYDEKPVAEGGKVCIYGYDPYTKDHILTAKDSNGHEYKGAEVTSQGFALLGLDPYRYYSAGYACFLTDKSSQQDNWDVWDNAMDITGVKPGDIIGYKYFNFDKLKKAAFNLFLTPKKGRSGKVSVWMDSPYSNNVWNGTKLGEIEFNGDDAEGVCHYLLDLGKSVDKIKRRHAIYLVAEGEGNEALFDLQGLGFSRRGGSLERPVPPQMHIAVNGEDLELPEIPTRSTDENGYTSQDIYELHYTVAPGAAKVEASSDKSGVSIKTEVHQDGLIEVRATYNGKTKTYKILPEVVDFGGWQLPEIKMEYSKKYSDVNYAGDGEIFHNMDIYLPKEEKESYPVVVHIYGSAWFSNNSKGMADLGTICQALLDAGYAVVTPNHRSSSDAKFPAQINDIKAVIRYIRAHAAEYKFDTSFIATSGFSSGGHLASLAGTAGNAPELEGEVGGNLEFSSAVNAVCDWSGPVDMFHMDCAGDRGEGSGGPEEAVMGFPIKGNEARFAALNATSYIDPMDPPVIIFHGNADTVVPGCQGPWFYECLTEGGVKADLNVVEGGGHGFNMYTKETLGKMVTFLNRIRNAK